MTIYEKLREMYGSHAQIEVTEPDDRPVRQFAVTIEYSESMICAFFVVPNHDVRMHGEDTIAENILTYRQKAELPS